MTVPQEAIDAMLAFLRKRFPDHDWQIRDTDEYLAAVIYANTL